MNSFENAHLNADSNCPKCNGTGTYMYDENHSTICNLCCKHNMGWWFLTKYYSNAGMMCCLAGCGKVITVEEFDKLPLEQQDGVDGYGKKVREGLDGQPR